jgi:pyruvate dehydrogenase (quinone)
VANASDLLIERLNDWGVTRIYGYPGDGINGVLGALRRAKRAPAFVQVRHEEQAAFMACAHAKFTGEVGVCLATSGPGAIHLLNGLYDAKADHTPVVAIVGQVSTKVLGTSYQQEVDLATLFKDVAHEYVYMASHSGQVRHLIDRAFRIAIGMRAVTCVILPKDVQEQKAVVKQSHEHETAHTGAGYSAPVVVPTDRDLHRAAEILNSGERVAMLVGAGALGATDEVLEVAELLGAGVAKALLGKACVPDDLPFVTGCIGLLGTRPSYEMMQKCDTLLMAGTTFPYNEFLPKEGHARAVQIDIDPRSLGLRYPTEINLQGDTAITLRALIPLLQRKSDRSWQDSLAKSKAQAAEVESARAMIDADPVNPQRVFHELAPRLPDRCILTGDAGTVVCWIGRHLPIRRGMKVSLSGGLATMGPAVPYAIAAKFCFPDRVAIALTGDGAMQMSGNAELLTIVKYWREWADPRLIVMVLNNSDLNMVTWEMRTLSGDPKFEASQNLPKFNYAAYAEQIGLIGIRVERPEDVGPAWDRALAANRPVVYDVVVDPNVTILPPHISFAQAKNFASAMLKGDPQGAAVIGHTVKEITAAIGLP